MSASVVERIAEPGNAYEKLLSIPPEVWASITNSIPGEQLARLKMTGDTKLWSRLCANRAMRSVFLGYNGCPFKQWPAYLNDLPSIEKLCIYNATEPWLQDLTMDMLPRTLRWLTLEGRKTLYSRMVDLSLEVRLPNLEKLYVNIAWSSGNRWLTGGKWENLVDLYCWSWDCSIPLPASLTRLTVAEVSPGSDSTNLAFPHTLERLKFHCKTNLDLLLPLLPPNLVSISEMVYGRPKNGTFTPEQLAQLPKSLTKVKLTTSDIIFNLPRPNERLFDFHPVTLEVTVLPSQYWVHLPKSLETLKISALHPEDATVFRAIPDPNGSGTLHYNTIPIATLPPSITELELTFQKFTIVDVCSSPAPSDSPSSIDQASEKLFPPLLRRLSLQQAQLSVEATKRLPASLTALFLSNFNEGICEHLPQRLMKLDAENVILTPHLIKYLPRSLTSLSLSAAVKRRRQEAPTGQLTTVVSLLSKGSNINPNDPSKFWEGECCLPTGLKQLNLQRLDSLNDSTILNQPLPHLESLNMATPLVTDAIIPHLSRHLRCLKLELAALITGKCFRHLPRHLTTLDLNGSAEIYDSDIQHLPHLNSLLLGSAVHLTNECVKDLPRTLSYIHMLSNRKITMNSVSDMPFRVRCARNTYDFTFLNSSWSIYQGKAAVEDSGEADDDEN